MSLKEEVLSERKEKLVKYAKKEISSVLDSIENAKDSISSFEKLMSKQMKKIKEIEKAVENGTYRPPQTQKYLEGISASCAVVMCDMNSILSGFEEADYDE